MNKASIFFLTLCYSLISNSEIFKCESDSGKLVFQDYKCDGFQGIKTSYDQAKNTRVSPDEGAIEKYVSGALVRIEHGGLSSTPEIVVNQVKVISETYNMIYIRVTYTYSNSLPSEDFRIGARPLQPYWSSASMNVSSGKNTIDIPVHLNKSNMEYSNYSKISSKSLSVIFSREKSKTKMANAIYYFETFLYEKEWFI